VSDIAHPFLPTPAQELLLKACLGSGADVVRYWERWRQQTDLEDIDDASQRLIPLLYRRLLAEGVEQHPLLEKYGGIYKRSWFRNGLLFNEAATLVRAFDTAAIPTMILKGMVLALSHYPDRGARPMADFDLLVPASQARASIELMRAQGWKAKYDGAPESLAAHPGIFVATPFTRGGRAEVDLHCHALARCVGAAADRNFWSHARRLDFDGISTRALDDTDLLLQVCVHGSVWNPVPPVRWVPDAALIVKSGRVDWHRLESDALEYQLVLPMRETLGYLFEKMECAVPESFLSSLRQARVPAAFRREHIAVQIPDFASNPWHCFWYHYARYRRSLAGENSPRLKQAIHQARSLLRGPLPSAIAARIPAWISRGSRDLSRTLLKREAPTNSDPISPSS
jgi:hypothetical protein